MAACIHCNGRGCCNCQKLDSAAHLRVMLNEARAEVERLKAEHQKWFNTAHCLQTTNAARIAELEAENARLRGEVEKLSDELGHSAKVNLDLRARLATAEAVCEAAGSNIVGRLQDFLNDDAKRSAALGFHNLGEDWLQSHARMVKLAEALEKWREGKEKT